MSEIAALLLCKIGGKAGSADDIKAVLEAAGAEVDDDALTKLTGDMEGKDINDLLAAGIPADEIYEALSTSTTELVLTAHPTEVNRRTTLESTVEFKKF